MPTRTIPYPPEPDPHLAARVLDRRLEGDGWRVQVTWDSDGAEVVQVTPRDQSASARGLFRPGQQLVVESGGAWRIENVARRHQLARKKGSRKPEGAVVVSRPGKWGNPFTIADCLVDDPTQTHAEAQERCVRLFAGWLAGEVELSSPKLKERRAWFLEHLHELRGKDLCCWCPLPDEGEVDWCHASVLMDLAAAAVTS